MGSALLRFLMAYFRSPDEALAHKADRLGEPGVAAYERNLRRLVRRSAERRTRRRRLRSYAATPGSPRRSALWASASSGLLKYAMRKRRSALPMIGCRSEERRVGKEGRSRWAPDH